MVKLLTHNFLTSNVRGVKNPYPLRIEAAEVRFLVSFSVSRVELDLEQVEHDSAEYDAELTVRMIPRLDYGSLLLACAAVGYAGLPPAPPPNPETDEAFLRALHHALFNINIVEGAFVCPESGRRFPIEGGIPNMVLNEDEV
jgi:multifunctional methyltransferase subunit TRM112